MHLIRKVLNSICWWLALFLAGASSVLKTRAALQLENVALRLSDRRPSTLREEAPRLERADRLLSVWLSRVWAILELGGLHHRYERRAAA